MLNCFSLLDGRVMAVPNTEQALINVYSAPTPEEKAMLITQYGIDEHTLGCALDEDEISRLEYEVNHVAVIMKRPRNYNGKRSMEFKVSSLGAFLFKDKIIIIQAESMPLFEHGRMPLRGTSVQGILLRLLHHSTHHFLEHLRLIRIISEEIEKKIEFSITNKALVNMFSLLKSLTYYESATSANQLLLTIIKNDTAKINFNQEEQDFLEDIMVENKQCANLAEIYTGILTGMSDARVSVVSNNLAIIMKYLTIINIVFMPLNVLTGMGGMSEFSMMTDKIWWPQTYSTLFLLIVIVGYITFLVIKRVRVTTGDGK
ncbi:MAG: magnesium transporter CorA family protein [Lentisphaeria bacterium]|nr:magnesium transporter CorA family protein [Lentisphaeria bacterium]